MGRELSRFWSNGENLNDIRIDSSSTDQHVVQERETSAAQLRTFSDGALERLGTQSMIATAQRDVDIFGQNGSDVWMRESMRKVSPVVNVQQ